MTGTNEKILPQKFAAFILGSKQIAPPKAALGRALSTLRGLRGAPEVPPLCRETQSLGQQMLERVLHVGTGITA